MQLIPRLILCLCLTQIALPAAAAPQRYQLDTAASEVNFTYRFSGAETAGTMPIEQAEVILDTQNVAASSATVVLNAAKTKTALRFATEPLKSPTVLNTDAFPTIRFQSKSVSGSLTQGGKIAGDITVRGVTRPIVLDAQIFRPQGSAPGDLSRLTLILTGSLNRMEFGAGGFPDLVGPIVSLHIRALISTQD